MRMYFSSRANGELGHSCTKVMESRLYDSRDRDHVNTRSTYTHHASRQIYTGKTA